MSQPTIAAPARWTSRAWRIVKGEAISQAPISTAIARANSGKPVHEASSTPPNMWLVFCRSPVTNTMMPCIAMNSTNQANDRKWTDRIA